MPIEAPVATASATINDWAPPLRAKLAPWMERFIQHPEQASKCIDSAGSPVHIVVTSEFKRNVKDLMAPFKERGLIGGLFFARKANKLPWFVSAANEVGIGVDTASLKELQETINLGILSEKIIVTAIGKSQDLISEAITHGCLLVIDNLDELKMVQAATQTLRQKARVGLRFSGFEVDGQKLYSRFGFPINDFDALLSQVLSSSFLQLELLHAHLDRYDIKERASAARQLIAVADHALKLGHKISSIDLGGGILIRYLEKESDWKLFLNELMDSVAGERPSFTYMADGFGFYKAQDGVSGKADLYPAWNDISKERFIAVILDEPGIDKVHLHKEISDRQMKLFFEPGRALLDNTGLTLSTITFTKRDSLGNLLIGTAMNRTNLRPFRAEFCSDPILLSLSPSQHIQEKAKEGAFIVGNLCSESDLIFRRKLKFPFLPQPQDILCFVNTAGYLAHHMEIGTHGNPLPTNLLVDEHTFEIVDSFGG